jgi:hypothetical protein
VQLGHLDALIEIHAFQQEPDGRHEDVLYDTVHDGREGTPDNDADRHVDGASTGNKFFELFSDHCLGSSTVEDIEFKQESQGFFKEGNCFVKEWRKMTLRHRYLHFVRAFQRAVPEVYWWLRLAYGSQL